MTHFRCYYLTSDNRYRDVPAEFDASGHLDAMQIVRGLYAGRDPAHRHGVELWEGAALVFRGDPTAPGVARAAA